MINSNSKPIQAFNTTAAGASASVSPVRGTFNSILAKLKAQPLQPLSVQRFAGAASRSLEQQLHSDTYL